MRTPLVLLNLRHQPLRTLVAIVGVAFAVLLLFMQLGFYDYAESAANALYRHLDFDLVLVSSNYLNCTRPRGFPLERLSQVRAHDDVDSAAPLYVDWQHWLIRQSSAVDVPLRGQRRAILVLAYRLDEPVFRPGPAVVGDCSERLRVPDTVLMDTRTRAYFGSRGLGEVTELNHRRIKVVGQFTIDTGLGSDGMVLTSERTFAHLARPGALNRPALGLIRLKAQARGRAEIVKKQLEQTFFNAKPRDEVAVRTRADIEARESHYWMRRTSVGIIFLIGVAVALIVGVIFVYQVIATDIANHFAEYATLRAIGYPSGYLSGVVLRQALVLAVLGYVPAFLAALGLYQLGQRQAELYLSMTPTRAAGVLLLTMAMCSLSGLLAMRKVKAADPADLF